MTIINRIKNMDNKQLKKEMGELAERYNGTYSQQLILEVLRRLKNGNL